MIKEDYVSFETAKLLKEKGFDESIETLITQEGKIYHLDENSISNKRHGTICNSQINVYSNDVSCPTLQMAMKWLREVHHIDIEVKTHYLNYLKPNDTRYYSGKILKGNEEVIHTIYSKNTYEEICEEAIKYSLENLI